ncbi:MAG: DUF790 family protein [Polyangiaceae bacterium]|nr:DUF790 family protein [Polyangiaceae bacterium]
MLTADLVRSRRRKGELVLVSLEGEDRQEAIYLAAAYNDLARDAVGRPRAQLDEAMGQVEAPPPLQRVADGLRKLVEDRCDFEPTLDLPPDELRREVFRRAAASRRELAPGQPFDRGAVLGEIARARNVAPDDLERGLYADLRGAHVLRAYEPLSPEALVSAYEDAQAQAVLLRAVRVRAEVKCGAAWGYRQLFAKLKFLRLLYAIEPLEGGGYRVDIDGPFSLFDSVTKYGLQLALSLPAIQACASWSVEADVRWGKLREALVFRLAGRGPDAREAEGALALPPEVEAFRQGFESLKSPWRVSPSPTVLNLPGAGLCVPDLVFERPKAPRVYFEVLGYWSRDAVWKRVDLVRQGLGEAMLFAVSERLRVSEDVLEDDPSGALYVYKGALSPRVVLKRLDARWGSGAAGETLPLPVASAAFSGTGIGPGLRQGTGSGTDRAAGPNSGTNVLASAGTSAKGRSSRAAELVKVVPGGAEGAPSAVAKPKKAGKKAEVGALPADVSAIKANDASAKPDTIAIKAIAATPGPGAIAITANEGGTDAKKGAPKAKGRGKAGGAAKAGGGAEAAGEGVSGGGATSSGGARKGKAGATALATGGRIVKGARAQSPLPGND